MAKRNHKSQIPNSRQSPNLGLQTKTGLRIWDLTTRICLGSGTWCLVILLALLPGCGPQVKNQKPQAAKPAAPAQPAAPRRSSSLGTLLAGKPESIRQFETAQSLFNRERYAEAGVAFREWLADYRDEQDVLRPFVLYRLADCYRLTRDHERAIRTYAKILELYGSSKDSDIQKIIFWTRYRLADLRPPLRPKTPGAETTAPTKAAAEETTAPAAGKPASEKTGSPQMNTDK